MMADLLINGKDAYAEWGVKMGTGFLDALGCASTLKEYITNESRLKDGTEYADIQPKVAERAITLPLTIYGDTREEYERRKRSFFDMLYITSDITISVPQINEDVYHFKYNNATSYGRSLSGKFGKITLKLTEPNPKRRY